MKHVAALMKLKEIWLLKRQNKDKENCCKKLSVEIWIKQNLKYTEKHSLNLLQLNLTTCLTMNPSQIKVKTLSLTPILAENLIRVASRV